MRLLAFFIVYFYCNEIEETENVSSDSSIEKIVLFIDKYYQNAVRSVKSKYNTVIYPLL